MLQRLYITNYALIDFLEISFESGLSSITGETGAGKSIILGALSLLLGKRCDTSVLKNKEEKSVVEIDVILDSKKFKQVFIDNDVDFEEHTIIRREITPQGKSRAFINDTPVSLQALKDIGDLLIDIHSQHQNLFLRESSFQCEVVDAAANNKDLLQQFAAEYEILQQKKKALNDFRESVKKHASDLQYMQFRLQELQQAHLKADELQELEQEAAVLEHGEDIKLLFLQAKSVLEDENSLLPSLKSIVTGFEKKASLSKEFLDLSQRLSQVYIELSDISSEIARYDSHLDFDPARLEVIHQRLDIIQSLIYKFGVSSVEELITEQLRLQEIISHIENADIDGKEYEKAFDLQQIKIKELALEIRKTRKKAIAIIEPQVVGMLQKLGMPNVTFTIELKELEQIQTNGADTILMKFSANKNIPAQWLGEVSSGGELSRVMLCLKAILSKSKSLQTIIFDEIDTGVSGEIADQMGGIMQLMAKDLQVIVITHLPQIAAKAKFQFKVFKEETSNTTTTNIITLNQEQRIEELAKMVSGKHVTDAAIQNAKHLLGIY